MKPSTLTLFLFRHGQTEWALSGQHTGRTDIPLTEEGKKQALALKDIASQVKFDAVFVSPLSRARQTAELAGLGDQMTIVSDLQEFDYGQYEGLTTKQIREKVPNWTIWTNPCPGGESLADAQKRCFSVIEMAEQYEGNVALFAHGHILRIMTTAWLQMPPENGKHFALDTATASVLSHEHEERTIQVWNARKI